MAIRNVNIRYRNNLSFEYLEAGDTFVYKDGLYIKTETVFDEGKGELNAFDLRDGIFAFISEETCVETIDIDIIEVRGD